MARTAPIRFWSRPSWSVLIWCVLIGQPVRPNGTGGGFVVRRGRLGADPDHSRPDLFSKVGETAGPCATMVPTRIGGLLGKAILAIASKADAKATQDLRGEANEAEVP